MVVEVDELAQTGVDVFVVVAEMDVAIGTSVAMNVLHMDYDAVIDEFDSGASVGKEEEEEEEEIVVVAVAAVAVVVVQNELFELLSDEFEPSLVYLNEN